ncbi:hypothetical protein Ahy_B02g060994 [Arachis hypogaea]|uniref:Uncharacterized protein n=1 Tax=Arachis hypogaea TaxID=3818 RepID=A0A445AJQ7_ARAHY|nr:hypothetical protein Ahy_B02g060994 [Arachis hypogaea]
MKGNNRLPNAVTYEIFIRALLGRDENEQAVKLLREMIGKSLLVNNNKEHQESSQPLQRRLHIFLSIKRASIKANHILLVRSRGRDGGQHELKVGYATSCSLQPRDVKDGVTPKCFCEKYAICYTSKRNTDPNRLFFGCPLLKVDDHIVRVRAVEITRKLGDGKLNDVEEHSGLDKIAHVEERIVNLKKLLNKKKRVDSRAKFTILSSTLASKLYSPECSSTSFGLPSLNDPYNVEYVVSLNQDSIDAEKDVKLSLKRLKRSLRLQFDEADESRDSENDGSSGQGLIEMAAHGS